MLQLSLTQEPPGEHPCSCTPGTSALTARGIGEGRALPAPSSPQLTPGSQQSGKAWAGSSCCAGGDGKAGILEEYQPRGSKDSLAFLIRQFQLIPALNSLSSDESALWVVSVPTYQSLVERKSSFPSHRKLIPFLMRWHCCSSLSLCCGGQGAAPGMNSHDSPCSKPPSQSRIPVQTPGRNSAGANPPSEPWPHPAPTTQLVQLGVSQSVPLLSPSSCSCDPPKRGPSHGISRKRAKPSLENSRALRASHPTGTGWGQAPQPPFPGHPGFNPRDTSTPPSQPPGAFLGKLGWQGRAWSLTSCAARTEENSLFMA